MPFNVNQFHAKISSTGGYAKASTFEVDVIPPGKLISGNGTTLFRPSFPDSNNTAQGLTFRVFAVTWPGRALNSMESTIYGAPYKMGGSALYTDVEMSIMCSPDLRERDFFLQWQDLVVGNHRLDAGGPEKSNEFDIGYYNDYVSDGVVIKQFVESNSERSSDVLDVASNIVPGLTELGVGHRERVSDAPKVAYECMLVKAFPSQVGTLSSSWSNDEFLSFDVTMSYRYFVTNATDLGNQPSERSENVFDKINKTGAGGAIGTAGGIVISSL